MNNPDILNDHESGVNWISVAVFVLACVVSVLVALLALPVVAPGMLASISGATPQAFWFLSRGSALAAFGLLWVSMALGIGVTNRMARLWPGGPQAVDLHEFASLLGLVFAVFHGLILLGDRYIGFTLAQVLIPFASSGYKPVWVGLGQIGAYLWGVILVSFYARRRIGTRNWRLIHYATYASFLLALIHGLASGTDSSTPWMAAVYWVSTGSLLFLTVYRILVSAVFQPKRTGHAIAPAPRAR